MTPRDLVNATLEFENKKDRVPQQLWLLPWAKDNEKDTVQKIRWNFPDAIVYAPFTLRVPLIKKGNPYEVGTYVDEWGCIYRNIQKGIVGEVKEPLVKDEDWGDWEKYTFRWSYWISI